MANLLFLGASVSQVAAMGQARAAGHVVLAVDGDSDAIGFAEADVVGTIDFSDVDAVVEFARRHGADGVLAISTDRAVPAAAAIAERLGLPGIGTDVAIAMTNKTVMRERLREHGVAQPPFVELSSPDDAARAAAEVGLPAVVKPVDSGGQRGLHLARSVGELRDALADAISQSRTGRAIAERYVDGGELNGILVVRNGEPELVTLSDRLRPPGVGFGVGWIHVYPSRLSDRAVEAAGEVAAAAVRALGLRDGIAFPQLLVDGDGNATVVEVAARIPAGQMADVVRHGTGVDLVDLAFRFALGEEVPDELVRPRFRQPLAVRFFTAQPGPLPTGRVVAVHGLERVRSASGVVQADTYIVPGEVIEPVRVDADRRGYVIAVADDATAALERANEAAKLLTVMVEQRADATTG